MTLMAGTEAARNRWNNHGGHPAVLLWTTALRSVFAEHYLLLTCNSLAIHWQFTGISLCRDVALAQGVYVGGWGVGEPPLGAVSSRSFCPWLVSLIMPRSCLANALHASHASFQASFQHYVMTGHSRRGFHGHACSRFHSGCAHCGTPGAFCNPPGTVFRYLFQISTTEGLPEFFMVLHIEGMKYIAVIQ